MNDQRQSNQPQPLRKRFPSIVGNALICSDGTTHQLRLLEKLYVRCGVLTLPQLDARYREDLPQRGA